MPRPDFHNLAVNVSGRQFRQQDLLGQIADVLAETGLEPGRLEIELTESMLIEDSDAVLRIMARLGAMGIRIAIDDFGTGGCDEVQGYLLSRPIDAEAFALWFAQHEVVETAEAA